MTRDIAADTLAVGNALASVRIDQMILNLAKGIAWGQYELDKVGVDIAKMMGVPGVVSIGGENLSMLEAGFVPSFYHFVDTILELKMEVSIREETNTALSARTETHAEVVVDAGVEVEGKVSVGFAEAGAKAHWNVKSTAGYSRSLDASYSQKYNQDLSAASLMRTKIVPIPPPDLLVERIKILLERLRKDAQAEDEAQIMFTIDGEAPDPNKAALLSAMEDAWQKLGHPKKVSVAIDGEFEPFGSNQWTFDAKFDGKEPARSFLLIANTSTKKINGYAGKQKKSLDDILMKKIEDRLLERVSG